MCGGCGYIGESECVVNVCDEPSSFVCCPVESVGCVVWNVWCFVNGKEFGFLNCDDVRLEFESEVCEL